MVGRNWALYEEDFWGIDEALGRFLNGSYCRGVALIDKTGQLITGTYMDYTMPRADDVPSFTVDTTVTACTHNPLGVKGCGEAGAIGAPAAVMNAVTDALGVKDLPMPATAEKVWRVLRGQ